MFRSATSLDRSSSPTRCRVWLCLALLSVLPSSACGGASDSPSERRDCLNCGADAAPDAGAAVPDGGSPAKPDVRHDAGHPGIEPIADAAAPVADVQAPEPDAAPLEDAGVGAPDAGSGADAGDATPGLSTLGNAELLPGSIAFYPGDVIFLARVVAPAAVEVAYMATIGKETGGAVRMALYQGSSDDPAVDRPTTRLAVTDDIPVVKGVVRGLPTTPVELVAGKSYWVTLAPAASSTIDSIQLYQRVNAATPVFMTTAAPFPPAFVSTLTKDPGPDFNFFLFVRASTF